MLQRVCCSTNLSTLDSSLVFTYNNVGSATEKGNTMQRARGHRKRGRIGATKAELLAALRKARAEFPADAKLQVRDLANKAVKYIALRPGAIQALISDLLTDEDRKTVGLEPSIRHSARSAY